MLTCPACDSTDVYVTIEELVNANTQEHFCFSVKAHDDDAVAECFQCGWVGQRCDLRLIEKGNYHGRN